MTRCTEVCVLLIGITVFCDIINSSPLFEQINIERKINIGFKPLKIRPLSFIREKWGSFGRFGTKHTIEKRALEDSNVIDKGDDMELEGAAIRTIPVIEKLDEPPVVVPLFVPALIPASSPPPVNILNTDISAIIPNNPLFTAVDKPPDSSPEPVPVVEPIPVDKPLFVPAEKNEAQNTPAPAPADPPPPPPVEQPKPRPGIFSFFTELFSELMARFIARARASFSQLTLPPVQQ